MLGGCAPLNCWFVGANDRTRCRGVSHTPPGRPGTGRMHVLGYDHSAPFGGVRDACQVCRVPGMRHASVTFDPAASACDMPGRQGRLPSLPGASAGVPASLSAFAVAFAQAAQVSRHLPWRLRRQRGVSRHLPWRLRRWRGVSRHLPWRLRKQRKSLSVCRDVCASSASLSAFTVAFAQAARGLSAFAAAFAQAARGLSAFARPGFLTALPRAGRWGVCWASSRRPTRGERRRRRGLHSARSAGC